MQHVIPEPLMPMPKKVAQDIKAFIESTEITEEHLRHFEHLVKRTLVLQSHVDEAYRIMETLKK